MLSKDGMAGYYADIHDRIVTNQLEGRAHALTAEAPLVFGTVVPGEENQSEQTEAQGATEGGTE